MSFVDETPRAADETRPSDADHLDGVASPTAEATADQATDASESESGEAQSQSYRVTTDSFEGPFDLLLHLILKDEVDLYEISLSTIVDAYLAEIEQMDLCDLETATEFLLIAATLVELKCRRLLPVDDDFDLDDELGIWEERDLLLSRLLECKTFKDAAKILDDLTSQASRVVARRCGLEDQFLELTPDLLAGVTGDRLRKAFIKAMTPPPEPTVDLFHVTSVTASVTDAIEELLDELPRSGPVSFRTLTAGLFERVEVVVRFLAVLELFKQGFIEIDQAAAFGDLHIEWIGGEIEAQAVMAGADLYEG